MKKCHIHSCDRIATCSSTYYKGRLEEKTNLHYCLGHGIGILSVNGNKLDVDDIWNSLITFEDFLVSK
jgi:hypothetical protein